MRIFAGPKGDCYRLNRVMSSMEKEAANLCKRVWVENARSRMVPGKHKSIRPGSHQIVGCELASVESPIPKATV